MNILFVGAHYDDIELGAGGFLSKSINNNDNIGIVIFSEPYDTSLDKVNERKYEFYSLFK